MSGPVPCDAAVIGGGIMGCTTALHLARGGMRVALLERASLCMAASGVNAGTLAMQTKPVPMIPYHLRAWELWRTAADWLGMDMGFRSRGSLVLAFTEAEAELQTTRALARRAAGAPVEFITLARARAIEPGLSDRPLLVSWCAMDGFANSSLTGRAYRAALREAGVEVREGTAVTAVEADGGFRLRTAAGPVAARRVVLAGGAWLRRMAGWFDVDLPIRYGAYQVAVTERMPAVQNTVISVANGLLTLKQTDSGTVVIGGGWGGIGDLDRGGVEVIPERLIGNIRLARHVIPALARGRVVRTWLGLSADLPDGRPVVGPLPGVADAFVIGGCSSGFTSGPLFGRLLAQSILGRRPDLAPDIAPFDPARFLASAARAGAGGAADRDLAAAPGVG